MPVRRQRAPAAPARVVEAAAHAAPRRLSLRTTFESAQRSGADTCFARAEQVPEDAGSRRTRCSSRASACQSRDGRPHPSDSGRSVRPVRGSPTGTQPGPPGRLCANERLPAIGAMELWRVRADSSTPSSRSLTIRRLLGAPGLRPVGRRQMHALLEALRPWPRALARQQINVGDRDYGPLLPVRTSEGNGTGRRVQQGDDSAAAGPSAVPAGLVDFTRTTAD
jgi:hypothetical protein